MDKNAAKKWRPTVLSLIQNQTADDATDAILLLLEAPGQKVIMVPAAQAAGSKPATPARRLRAVPTGPADTDPDPPDENKEPLDPFAFFTVEEGAAYLGIGRERMYQVLKADPEKIPYKKERGANGRDEYRLSGRGLNAYRYERMQSKTNNGSGGSE